MAAAYAEEIGAMYLETSAKEDLNVQDIFIQLSTFDRLRNRLELYIFTHCKFDITTNIYL